MTQTPQKHLPGDERRQAIAAAVRALIAEKGFEGLRTRDIADRVGINIATLHYHVPSKEALVELVAQSICAEFDAMNEAHPRAGLSPLEELRLELANFRRTRRDNPQLIAVLDELSRRARHDANVARQVLPMRERWRQVFIGLLTRGRDDGSFRADLDPEAAAMMIIGAIVAFRERPADAMTDLYDAVAEEIVRSVIAPSVRKDFS